MSAIGSINMVDFSNVLNIYCQKKSGIILEQKTGNGPGTDLYIYFTDLIESLEEYLEGNKMGMKFYMWVSAENTSVEGNRENLVSSQQEI